MPDISVNSSDREFVISRLNAMNGAWYVGRASMQYRDLIPGRLGGRFIASHIRIPDGGETEDYVHYHKALFQMIYCKTGLARLVYEDQGPPFAREAGGCVLQPPEIRHRVLESSPGLEVIEVACPAEYETRADNKMLLPTREVSPERLFGGQCFAFHRARDASWAPWRLEGFDARDTGVAAATNGLAAARIVKSKGIGSASTATARARADAFLFLFILQGELLIDSAAQGNHQLQAGDSCVVPAGVDYTLRAGAGLEMLEVNLPAEQPQR